MAYIMSQSSVSSDRPLWPTAILQPYPLVFVVELKMGFRISPTPFYQEYRHFGKLQEPIRIALMKTAAIKCIIKKKIHNDFATWCITENNDDPYGFDIVSPKLQYYDRDFWLDELNRVYSVIRKMECVPSYLWGTKIHIRTQGPMLRRQMKALANTIIRHNYGFNELARELKCTDVHSDAHSLVWLQNFDVNNPSDRTKEILEGIDSAQSVERIAELMNTDWRGQGHLRAWNFWPMVPDKTGPMAVTYHYGHPCAGFVEYNLAPGSATPQDATLWIDLACLFTRGALKHDGRWGGGTAKGPDPNLLRESNLLKFVLEQAEEADIPRTSRERLQEKLAFLNEVDKLYHNMKIEQISAVMRQQLNANGNR
ncbi:hypothetical protein F4860DRAFT_519165 [Xylaria cubensis]|nr:hypothetical protein F4860DRAFT_519165 [Xylaria cubensis]